MDGLQASLLIIGGQHNGACVEKIFYLKSQGAIDFLEKELKLIGFEIEGGDELEARKSEIIGTRIEFTAQVNNQGFLVLYAKGAVKGAAKTAVTEKKKTAWQMMPFIAHIMREVRRWISGLSFLRVTAGGMLYS